MNNHMKVSILGCIGSGKSTTCEIIARDNNVRFFRENFEENPYLNGFYDNCKDGEEGSTVDKPRDVYQLQLWFFNEYQKVAKGMKSYNDYIVDCGPLGGISFVTAQTNLGIMTKHEHDVYFDLWMRYFLEDGNLDKDCKFIILDREIPDLMSKIAKRARKNERNIDKLFIKEVKNSYLKLPEILRGANLDIEVLRASVSESKEMVANRVVKKYKEMCE